MEKNILELINEQSCYAQGSNDWFRARLGCVSSSMVYIICTKTKEQKDYEKLLKSPLKKTETQEDRNNLIAIAKEAAEKVVFTDSAIGYLNKLAAERNLQKRIINDDEMFTEYLQRVAINTRAVRYGSDNEDIAREIYKTKHHTEVSECGFVRHKEIDMYGDSPDGIALNEEGMPIRAIEIKFPNPDTWVRYATTIFDAATLKAEKPEYYWQCQSHIECCRQYFGCESCDFVFCDKMQKNGYIEINIQPNEADIAFMLERVKLANEYINNTLKIISQR